MKNNPVKTASDLLSNFGIDDPSQIEIEEVVHALDIPFKQVPMKGCLGRIIHGKEKSMIAINSDIQFESRKRFTIAHELGHYLMHRKDNYNHNESINTVSWNSTKNKYKITLQESEANQFASELLLPTDQFKKAIEQPHFSPDLIRTISDMFKVSRSSVIYRFTEVEKHPLCVFYTQANKVKYWRKSSDFRYSIKDLTNISPPTDSVSAEYFNDGRIYSVKDAVQDIDKSTWLNVHKDYANDTFYEFCMVYSSANLALSVIWED